MEKYNTTHLFYHRSRGECFIQTIKNSTTRRSERGKTAGKIDMIVILLGGFYLQKTNL